MIRFNCECGKRFDVPDSAAGRRAKCKACGRELAVPLAETHEVPFRTRRLMADQTAMEEAFAGAERVKIEGHDGTPPRRWTVTLRVDSFEAQDKPRGEHVAEIVLHDDYPRLKPHCRMLTPVFHPNIDTETICVGDHWTAGEQLPDLVHRIAEMLAYQAYNTRSPLNALAARWADTHTDQLPTDKRPL